MNNINKKELHTRLIKTAKTVQLSAAERSEGLKELSAFVDAHPAAVVSPYLFRSSVWMRSGAVALLLIAITAGTATAAQGSLPGDVLYGVKIHFTEGLEGLFTFGAQNNAKFNQIEIERRIGETEVLSAEGRLSPEAKAELSANLISNTDTFDQYVAEVAAASNTPEAVDLSSQLNSTLQLHSNILQTLGLGNISVGLSVVGSSSTTTLPFDHSSGGASSSTATTTHDYRKRHSPPPTGTSTTQNISSSTEPTQGPIIRIYLSPSSSSATVTVPPVVVPPVTVSIPAVSVPHISLHL